jgi:hypothetical protein
MERKQIEIGNPVTVEQITLIPVVELSLNSWYFGNCFSCFATKQAVSIVVVSSSWTRAFRINGEEVSLDQFIKETPGIREALEVI